MHNISIFHQLPAFSHVEKSYYIHISNYRNVTKLFIQKHFNLTFLFVFYLLSYQGSTYGRRENALVGFFFACNIKYVCTFPEIC